jgi:AcrR family transcriptional regulator
MNMKKQEIFKAALNLFVHEGFHGTSTAAIAEKATVANGTLFHYFKTKETLIHDLYLEVMDNFLITVTDNYRKEADLRQRFSQIWSDIVQWALKNPDEFHFVQEYNNSPFKGQLTSEQVARHGLFFRKLFTEGKSKNIFKELPVDLLMQMSFAQVNGLIGYMLDCMETSDDSVNLDIAFDCYWNSICK